LQQGGQPAARRTLAGADDLSEQTGKLRRRPTVAEQATECLAEKSAHGVASRLM
jgi:hypothetical protein